MIYVYFALNRLVEFKNNKTKPVKLFTRKDLTLLKKAAMNETFLAKIKPEKTSSRRVIWPLQNSYSPPLSF